MRRGDPIQRFGSALNLATFTSSMPRLDGVYEDTTERPSASRACTAPGAHIGATDGTLANTIAHRRVGTCRARLAGRRGRIRVPVRARWATTAWMGCGSVDHLPHRHRSRRWPQVVTLKTLPGDAGSAGGLMSARSAASRRMRRGRGSTRKPQARAAATSRALVISEQRLSILPQGRCVTSSRRRGEWYDAC